MHDVRNTRNKSDSERRASKAILIKPYYTINKTIHSPPPRTLRTEEPAMNATENTPAKAHQRAAASAESPEVVDLTDFSDAEEPQSAAKADEEAAPKPGVAEEPHTSDGDMYADMELDADEAGAADHVGSRDSPPLFSRRPSGFRRENLWSPPPY
ncbi:uncharacterized protein LOC117194686 [Drosophila miranda]|uniref:uncharacterized protein LOC117194686 n=1 Tax=Drosophila miranda TaxID=7229 RepID=UPI00143F17AB|nr:uncharacterized protein LOC117194686 [Drosophila miranda]